VRLALLLLAGLAVPAAAEEEFPAKGNVEITVTSTAGTSADISARVLAEGMSKQLGVGVTVVNRPGGGVVGYKYVASRKPDGYAMVWHSNAISTGFYSGQLAFDYHDFDPVASVLFESPMLAVRSDAKWKSLGELIADAKAHPGAITVANSGAGGHTHLSSVALFSAAGVQVSDVPYGGAQVMPNLLGGHVDAAMQLPSMVLPHVKSGAVRALANAPLEAWRGIAVPKGTPIGVIAIIEYAIRRTVDSPDFQRSCEKYAMRPAFLPSAQFGDFIARDDAEIARLMQLIGLKKPS